MADMLTLRDGTEARVRRKEGAYGSLIFGACRFCEWRSRARYESGTRWTTTNHIWYLTQDGSLHHMAERCKKRPEPTDSAPSR